MRLLVGPVAPECAAVWTEWALEAIDELRAEGLPTGPLPPETVDAIDAYVQAWAQATRRGGKVCRWQSEVDPGQLEYLTNALYKLDGHLSAQVTRGRRPAAPPQAEVFHGVLVEALLHALSEEGPCRAAFSEQLGQTWPALGRPM
ncbi:MAG: hypothetical protein M3133_04045 [Actinomycetota bacterium]|nr:hypothetical protein [Actinomycetota bacterium]